MVRTSEKAHLLNGLMDMIEDAFKLESMSLSEDEDYSNSSYSSDNDSLSITSTDSSSEDESLFPMTDTLMEEYYLIQSQCYTVPRSHHLGRQDKLINLLDKYHTTDKRTFRGLVRMEPAAFDALCVRLQTTSLFDNTSLAKVREMTSVALFWLGRFGNASGERDVALQAGCSVGSVIEWTQRTVHGLVELNREVMTFASEAERSCAKDWVAQRSGVPEWGRGWLVVDGTHVPMAWRPARDGEDYLCYKGGYSMNVALVMLPNSLRIVEYVVGHPGRAQDSRVWTAGSNILRKPRLYLDEGEFVWQDGGYGHSAFTVGPYPHSAANRVDDFRRFNYWLSNTRIRAEHGIAYLKNRFQCLNGYRGNMYRSVDQVMATHTIQACIIAHTFASRYDQPDDIAELLGDVLEDGEAANLASGAALDQTTNNKAVQACRVNQANFARSQSTLTQGMSTNQLTRHRTNMALDLREEIITSLFEAKGFTFVDTTPESRRVDKSAAELELQQQQSQARLHQRAQVQHSERQRRRQSSVRQRQAATLDPHSASDN